jgi:hypothetical protein
MKPIIATNVPWRAEFHGGRLADVYHAEYDSVVANFEVDGWDWATSTTTATRADVERGLLEWIAEDAADYARELPYMR